MRINASAHPPEQRSGADCRSCWVRPHCVLGHLAQLTGVAAPRIAYSGALPRNTTLFEQHAPAHAVLSVRTGSVKTALITSDGTQHVMGFHLPGELLGLDDAFADRYAAAAVTLERTSVCSMRTRDIDGVLAAAPGSAKPLLTALGEENARQREARLLLREGDAMRRLEAFLLDWSNRLAARGQSRTDLVLNMSRYDIGGYLAMAPETVSRKLTLLQALGVVRLAGRHVHLERPELLAADAAAPAASAAA